MRCVPPPQVSLWFHKQLIEGFYKEQLQSAWVTTPPPLRALLSGSEIVAQFCEGSHLSEDAMTAVTYMIKTNDDDTLARTPFRRARHIVPPRFAATCQVNHLDAVAMMFDAIFSSPFISYDPSACRMIFVPFKIGNAWLCMVLDTIKRLVLLLDPFKPKVEDSTVPDGVAAVMDVVLSGIAHCLRASRNPFAPSPVKWSKLLLSWQGDAAERDEETGILVALFLMWFTGESLRIPLDRDHVIPCKKQVCAMLCALDCNPVTVRKSLMSIEYALSLKKQ